MSDEQKKIPTAGHRPQPAKKKPVKAPTVSEKAKKVFSIPVVQAELFDDMPKGEVVIINSKEQVEKAKTQGKTVKKYEAKPQPKASKAKKPSGGGLTYQGAKKASSKPKAPPANEFDKDAKLFPEATDVTDFRSTVSRKKEQSRSEYLDSVKKQLPRKSNALQPDVPLVAGPVPTTESRTRKTAANPPPVKTKPVPSKRTVSSGAIVMYSLVGVIAILLVTLFIVFFVTGKKAQQIVPQLPVEQLSLPPEVVSDPVVLVDIRSGMTARQVCQLLVSSGLVADSQQLLDYLVANNLAGTIQQGSFLLKKGMSIQDIAQAITSKPSATVDVTVFPGYTLQEIDRMLASRGYAKAGDFLEATTAIAHGYGLAYSEGWFYPGVYSVPPTDAAQPLALSMFSRMLMEVNQLLDGIAALDRSINDVLIVASMIQRETNKAQEMPLIAGIIYKRLDEGIALGIDATTRYETGNWTDPINPVDLETHTPYNTRRKKGLPPSGIGAIGADALYAAVYPQDSDWYYYLHGTDGQIHFARDYEEHKRNIATWR